MRKLICISVVFFSVTEILSMEAKMRQKNDSCKIDKEFQSIYKRNIHLLKRAVNHRGVTKDKFLNSLHFLGLLTNIKSQVYFGDYIGYSGKKDFREDKAKWLNWYEENKCSFTMEKTDSMIRSRGYTLEQFQLK